MQGQILGASVTSNQGLILGDDGARYTFVPGGWHDASVKAEAGMRVEFSPQGAAAVDVLVIQAAPPPAPVPIAPAPLVSPVYPQHAPPQMRQAPYPPPASQPPPQRPAYTPPATPAPGRPPSTFCAALSQGKRE